jgi:23S rRNA (cytosine1962-C5)-methyltransferase
MTDTLTYPQIKLLPKASPQRVRFGFPWVFANELVMDRRTRKIPAGEIVQLNDNSGAALALCAFNAESKIAGRVLSLNCDTPIDEAWIKAKIASAAAHRDRLYDEPYYRLVHAEADGMPGVIIDRFGDVFAVQPNAAWADQRMPKITAALVELFGAKVVVKNASGRARKLDGLDEETVVVHGALDAPVPVKLNGATYMADVVGGQKTGLFLDQRDNQALAARLAKGGDVLDVFSHVGGFGLAALAGGATSALAVDGSRVALDLAEQGAEKSGFANKFSTHVGDAFETMASLIAEGRKFDVVICDPPAFAPAKPALEAGLRAYERIARLGAQLVADGGYLVLCSCSHAAGLDAFRTASLRGIGKAGRSTQIIHTGQAGPDHPVHPHLAESAYLKSIFLRML